MNEIANVEIELNGEVVSVPSDTTILAAAKMHGTNIPTLCHHPDQRVKANCRVCVVEVEGSRNLVAACATKVSAGMKVRTNTPRVRETVKTILELIFANHPQECPTCIRNGNCELAKLAATYAIREIRAEEITLKPQLDVSTPAIVRDMTKCIKCGRCAEVCHHVQEAGVLYSHNRGIDICISPEYGKELAEVACALCGQCILVCPVGAIHEKDDTETVWTAIAAKDKHVVVQVAPAVRVSIAEEFGQAPGTIATGKLVAALRRLGFDRVFDTNFTADLTIMEEGHELLARMEQGGPLPLITSCSPGWIKFVEHHYPEYLPHLSTCKSPQQMFGALAKTYYAQKAGIPAQDIFVVSIMPCTAKKFESARAEMNASGYRDVDAVLTTRELGRMIKQAGIEFDKLAEASFDSPLGIGSGAGAIFGATGGVMEAALRTVYEVVCGKELATLEFQAVRGMEGVREASIDLAGREIRVAVAHGLANARKIMELVRQGETKYAFIEVMGCPGGCIGGGGQPYSTNNTIRQERIQALYRVDEGMQLRKSHQNPEVAVLYQEFLGKPLGEMSHKLLHTQYRTRSLYKLKG